MAWDRKAHYAGEQPKKKIWRKNNPEKCKLYAKRSVEKLKFAAFEKLGNRCSNPACQWLNGDGTRGCVDERCLQIDHVRGDGPVDKRAGLRGGAYYKQVLSDETGRYQLLCANCNWIKRRVNNECIKPKR